MIAIMTLIIEDLTTQQTLASTGWARGRWEQSLTSLTGHADLPEPRAGRQPGIALNPIIVDF